VNILEILFVFADTDRYNADSYGSFAGPPATIGCKPRQVRKEATVAADSCAGVWLAKSPPNIS